MGIRLKDARHPRFNKLKKIATFPINKKWRVAAVLKRYNSPKMINTPTVLGTIEQQLSPGILEFKVSGKTYAFHPVGGDSNLFIVFGDKTNTVETYGGGRFLSVKKPDEKGNTFIDFNKAYNPPCVFSSYATCPLPAEENILPIRITAGEKMVTDFKH